MRKLTLVILALMAVLVYICAFAKTPSDKDESELKDEIVWEKDGAEMVLIPAGEFQMGTDSAEIPELVEWAKKWYPDVEASFFEDETPRHKVYVDEFYMDKYEVTNEQFKKFTDETGYVTALEKKGYLVLEGKKYKGINWKHPLGPGSKIKDKINHPVVWVNWHDAQAYCKWAGKRLPTEAEWEKAARGGLVGKKLPWGDSEPDGTQCNFADRNTDYNWSDKNVDDGYQDTAPVGSYTPNGYGLYDMAGNVWEWCADWYDSNYYSSSLRENPPGPASGKARVCRGGSWFYSPGFMRVAYRNRDYPSYTFFYQGFRCVLSSPVSSLK